MKNGKTKGKGKTYRTLQPEEIEERKSQLDTLLAASSPMDDAAERHAPGIGPTPPIQPENTKPELTKPNLAPDTRDLYIMENSRIPGEVKIGCSKDVPRRKKEFEAQQNFRMNVLVIFPGKGYLEKQVHDKLNNFRVTECAGTEWFKCSLGEALAAIDQVMRCA